VATISARFKQSANAEIRGNGCFALENEVGCDADFRLKCAALPLVY